MTIILEWTLTEVMLASIAAGIGSLITIAVNSMVILAFIIDKRVRTVSHYFLLSMSTADLIVGLFSMPLYTMYLILGYWPLSSDICDVWLSIDYVCCAASIFGILTISIDRYRSLTEPMLYRNKMTKRHAIIIILVTWTFSICLFFLPIMGWQYFEGERTVPDGACEVQFLNDPYFTTGSIVAAFWLPLFVTLFIYCKIYIMTRRIVQLHAAKEGKIEIRRHYSKQYTSRRFSTVSNSPTSSPSGNDFLHSHQSSNGGILRCGHLRKISLNEIREVSENSSNMMERTDKIPEEDIEADEFHPCLVPLSNRIDELEYLPPPKECERNELENKLSTAASPKRRKISVTFRDDMADTHYRRKSHLYNVDDADRRQNNGARDRKALRTLSLILGSFIVCWVPYSIFVIVIGFCPTCIDGKLYAFSYWLCYINSACNPFCYAFSNKQFRVAFKRILTCRRYVAKWNPNFSTTMNIRGRALSVVSQDNIQAYQRGFIDTAF
ncbi:muscarinic acetylcholine receptor M2-like [Saccoglossus kowalevskii]|uniref:Muscarinic acetylcholine receptor M5-like n=1 Tax=Saccoglossus kowalevskii TaxID=10224 RepID=A0ABM0GMV6_SACKO|nr:PREDICTED: muscarinic acetylcholine receptor M5-like [Saccoglossus kowalevskii]